MKKIIFYGMAFLGTYFKIYSQNICSTLDTAKDLLQQIPSGQRQASSNNYVVRIFIHVMRKDDGSDGQDAQSILYAQQIIAGDLEAKGLCASVLGSDEIWSTSYYNQITFYGDGDGDGKIDNYHPNAHSNAVDIYLLGADSPFKGGWAAAIPSTSYVVGGTLYSFNLVVSHVVSHEMGHCLGLFHTNHGFCEPTNACQDDGTYPSCQNCGDYICDVPPDPSKSQFNNACEWNGNTCNGITGTFNPDSHNLMIADINPACFLSFSNDQGQRMRDIIANTTLLQGVIVPNSLTINNLTVGSGVTKLYHVLNDLTLQTSVTVSANGTLTLWAGGEIALENNFSADNSSQLSAYIDNTCSSIDVSNLAKTHAINPNEQISMKDNLNNSRVRVYPVPATNNIYVQISNTTKNFLYYRYLLVDITGRVIKKGYLNSDLNSIQITEIANGIYFLRISQDGYFVESKKIIKN